LGVLDNILANDAQFAFCDTVGGFAEQVTYTRQISGVPQTPVTLNVIVDRLPVEQMPESHQRVKPVNMVISRTAVNGLTSRPLRGDLVSLAWQVGEAVTTFRVVEVPDQNDPGIWQIRAEASIG